MEKRILLFLLLTLSFSGISQKSVEAYATSEKIVIDGKFTENGWKSAQKIAEFVQYSPQPGNPSGKKTEVQIMYDNSAIYIAATCHENPQNVSKVLSQRDDFNANVDYFQVTIDTYNDDQNGFNFGVSSMGVQSDAKISVNSKNNELNMVWNSAVEHTENGWQLEMRIPFSAIRFPKIALQDWGINFLRYVSHMREESTWNAVKPEFDNWPAQCGTLTKLEGIEPPTRLAFMPYISSYADHYSNGSGKSSNWSRSINGGMDIKYGINEAFTLDMTLVPDFGQVVFDNQVLNLSPFEIQFNENRQFFTEGTELFGKSGLFYTRRIGIQSPYSVLTKNLSVGEYLTDIPPASQLFNATKLSGRTKNGLGIGVFNAITAEQNATAVNEETGETRTIIAAPLTNFNILVLDQNLKNNSSITLTNTNVLREGNFYDANVSGLNMKLNTEDNAFFISGRTALSNKFESSATKTGYNYGVQAGKQTGKVIFSASYFEESNTYDPNDLGFNTNNNKRIAEANIRYRKFTPFWRINKFSGSLTLSYNRLYKPSVFTATYLSGSLFANSKKFHAAGFEFNSALSENFDYFEPRSVGRYFTRPKWLNVGAWISSNYQKKFAIDINFNYVFVARENWMEYYYEISPRVRLSEKLFLVYEFNQNFSFNSQGFAVNIGNQAIPSEEIIFGSRDRMNITNTINLQFTATNRMGVTFRLRHYRSTLSYDSFYNLNKDGTLSQNNLTGLDGNGVPIYNTNYNAFTIDLVYRWVFLPGSEINIVWKNSIFSNDKNIDASYFSNISTVLDYSPLNSFSIKILYWLDYQSLIRKKPR